MHESLARLLAVIYALFIPSAAAVGAYWLCPAGVPRPLPTDRKARYFFRLAARDCVLPDQGPRARRADLERAMNGHVRATAVLMGTYAHPKELEAR